jgi:hypothetical protein
MANIAEARKVIRGLKPELGRKKNGSYPFKYQGTEFLLNDSDIDEYLKIKETIKRPEETAFYTPGFYEHVIELQGRGPGVYRLFRENDEIELKHQTNGFSIELSSISTNYALSLCDTDSIDKDIKRYILRRSPMLRDRGDIQFKQILSRVFTIKVKAPESHPFSGNIKQLRSIADAGIYHIAYGNGVGITLSSTWDRSGYWLDTRRREDVQFPLRTYHSELVAYYQLALGSESLILSYLALYKILEYFFTSASEDVLHKKVKEQLVSPDFSHSKVKKLRELVKTVRAFDQRMDERKMLLTVLNSYLDNTDLANWVIEYDRKNSGHYTSEREIFGEPLKVDVSENQLFPTVAKRIYHIRNALVHNKEGEISRFIPFSGQERILFNETPLLLYIAEELILKTGKDINF